MEAAAGGSLGDLAMSAGSARMQSLFIRPLNARTTQRTGETAMQSHAHARARRRKCNPSKSSSRRTRSHARLALPPSLPLARSLHATDPEERRHRLSRRRDEKSSSVPTQPPPMPGGCSPTPNTGFTFWC